MTGRNRGGKALVLLRHGRTEWTETGRIAGWEDPPLSGAGLAESACAGRELVRSGLRLDAVVTSLLRRSVQTAEVVLGVYGTPGPAVVADWRLNERHFGALQGLDHEAARRRYGKEALRRWKREGDAPPALASEDRRHPRHDPRYRHLDARDLPGTESLTQLACRVAACYDGVIGPMVEEGATVLVVAHRHSLAALAVHASGEPIGAPGPEPTSSLMPGGLAHLEVGVGRRQPATAPPCDRPDPTACVGQAGATAPIRTAPTRHPPGTVS